MLGTLINWLGCVPRQKKLFSANIQHNCPILFGICPTYLPAGLAFRFSFQKQLHLHFQGKWPLSPSSFERLSYSQRFILQNYQMKSAGIMTLMLDHLCDWLPELCRLQPQLYFIQLQHQFQLLLLCSDTGKNMIENYFRVLRKHFLFCVNFSWNFFHTIFRPQATIGTKNPGNPTTNTAKITPFFYKRGNKIVKFHSMNWSIERWIVENVLAVILTQKLTS